ncbi:HlyC/CorC family transporter [Paenibacillus hemerocallicola]|jgi:CBS domain containing-hemolysin-like protein|uniref:HlyC/CorC family transporter n=1 Tax=Paenibacillus hemerocallicola TaxID=1172614 RepID=A0A5C4TAG6_9BACL|nr:HlyC/CorC family transporter [Paenibacillus hemerocallicola]
MYRTKVNRYAKEVYLSSLRGGQGNILEGGPLPLGLSIALVLVLVGLNGFFVAAEFAVVKIRGSRIESLVRDGVRRAKFARTILADLNAYLSACQLGITLTSLGLGWIGEPAVSRLLEPAMSKLGVPDPVIHTIAFIIAFAFITTLHITIGEQYPKTYAISKPERITLWIAAPLLLFYKLMRPFIWILNGVSNWMLKKSGVEPDDGHESVHTEEEIRILVKESHRNGLIDKTELTLVDNIFEFSETNSREIMIPRTEMVCLYANMSYEDNKRIAIEEMHTRYPICDPDKDNVVGFVHIKEMLKHHDAIDSILTITRPLMKVPDSMPISTLLRLMQRKRTEMALLIDEYGGTSGLVTIEDIMEEIVGEIHDEFDEGRPRIEKKSPFLYSIDGLLLIHEVNHYFGTEVETDNYDTIGGWLYSQVEIPPRHNQCIHHNGFEYTIEEVDHMRISRLTVRLPDQYEMPVGQEVS